jgi:hypothetical protein
MSPARSTRRSIGSTALATHAVVDLVAELLIVGLWAAYLVIGRRARG